MFGLYLLAYIISVLVAAPIIARATWEEQEKKKYSYDKYSPLACVGIGFAWALVWPVLLVINAVVASITSEVEDKDVR